MSSTKVLVFVVLNLLTYKETHKSIPQIGTKYSDVHKRLYRSHDYHPYKLAIYFCSI